MHSVVCVDELGAENIGKNANLRSAGCVDMQEVTDSNSVVPTLT